MKDDTFNVAFCAFGGFAAHRDERRELAVESFGEPRVPCVRLKRLPWDIADVFGVAKKGEFPVFVPRVVRAEVEDAGGAFEPKEVSI